VFETLLQMMTLSLVAAEEMKDLCSFHLNCLFVDYCSSEVSQASVHHFAVRVMQD
jgi:hypothetical protein